MLDSRTGPARLRASIRRRASFEQLEARRLQSVASGGAAARALAGEPEVLESHLKLQRRQVTGFVIRFSKPMDPQAVAEVSRYEVMTQSDGPAAPILLKAAIYDPRRREITLVPAIPAAVGTFYVHPSGNATPDFLVDTSGRPLDTRSDSFAMFRPGVISPGQSAQRDARQKLQIIRDASRHKSFFGTIGRALNPFGFF